MEGGSCPFCWVNQCKKHPRQDHGKTAKALGPTNKTETLNRMFNDMIGTSLNKLKALASEQTKLDEKERRMVEAHMKSKGVRDTDAVLGLKPVSDDSSSDSESRRKRKKEKKEKKEKKAKKKSKKSKKKKSSRSSDSEDDRGRTKATASGIKVHTGPIASDVDSSDSDEPAARHRDRSRSRSRSRGRRDKRRADSRDRRSGDRSPEQRYRDSRRRRASQRSRSRSRSRSRGRRS